MVTPNKKVNLKRLKVPPVHVCRERLGHRVEICRDVNRSTLVNRLTREEVFFSLFMGNVNVKIKTENSCTDTDLA